MVEERQRLRQNSIMLRDSLRVHGWKVGTGDSPIIPVYLGTSERALAIASSLRSKGFFVTAIRPPSVPVNQALLRISLSINHSQDQMRALIECMQDVRKKRGGVDQETIDAASHGG
jgi:8-amino-7-oxononanoate synthase